MKSYLSIVLVVVCILLAVGLVVTKRGASADMETATGSIVDFSNRLDTAQAQLTVREGTVRALSNSVAGYASSSVTLSNELTAAQSALELQGGQITNLNRQVLAAAAENQALGMSLVEATNELGAVKTRLTQTEINLTRVNLDLAQLHKDYGLLQNRLQRDVAERVVVERRFNNLHEITEQAQKLKTSSASAVTADSIYKGLDIEVRSNGVAYVISPD